MSAPATHPCDACGGSGIGSGLRCPCHGAPSTCCPVCLGAGSFPDRMPARDALADAETLRLVFAGKLFGQLDRISEAIQLIPDVWERHDIGRAGICAGRALAQGGWAAHAWAAESARAAFRAVPGLRGE